MKISSATFSAGAALSALAAVFLVLFGAVGIRGRGWLRGRRIGEPGMVGEPPRSPPHRRVHGRGRARAAHPGDLGLRTGQGAGPFLLLVRRADGSEVVTRTYCAPFHDREGGVTGAVVTSEEIDVASSVSPGFEVGDVA